MTGAPGLETLGGRIRAARLRLPLTQEELAVAAGVRDPVTVSRWETNRAVPSEMVWPKLCQALRVGRDYLQGPAGERQGAAGTADGAELVPDTHLPGRVSERRPARGLEAEELAGRPLGETLYAIYLALTSRGMPHEEAARLCEAVRRSAEREKMNPKEGEP